MPVAAHSLKRFFAPRALALVGATEDLAKFSGRCLRQMINFGFAGEIYPINPKYREIAGLPCYPDISDTPRVPDHVGIAVPSRLALPALEACADRGVSFATVFSAGFAEAGTPEGCAMQADLAAFARRTGMRLMGPNCNGFINFVDGVALTSTSAISGPRRDAGRIGIVSHSGGVGQISVMLRAQEIGLGISYQVSCGNDADLDALDYMNFMIEDAHTDIVMVIAERISAGDKFFALARKAAEREKPIVLVKLGRTEQGSRAAASHTGAVTGSDAVHDAAFRQGGVIRVDDCSELYLTAMALSQQRWPAGNRCSALAISGGNLVLLSDLGAALGLDWPDYTEDTKEKIGALLPGFGKVTNPTDLTAGGIGDAARFRKILETLAADPNIDIVVPVITSADRDTIDTVRDFSKKQPKLAPVLWTGTGRGSPPLTNRDLISDGVPVYRDILPCMKAVRATVDYARFLRRFAKRKGRLPERPAGIDRALAAARLKAAGGVLTERAGKLALAAYGLPVANEALARNAEEAMTLAGAMGPRLALKIESADIPHKTEAGAIRLDVAHPDIAGAFAEVMEAARRHAPRARLDGVLVQEMAAPGIEMILGVTVDPVFGPVVAAGFGGIHVEILQDIAYGVPPLDHDDARTLIAGLRGARILAGVRGKPARDLDALHDAIVRLSWFAHDFRDLLGELDINPLILHEAGHGATAVDALISLKADARAAAAE